VVRVAEDVARSACVELDAETFVDLGPGIREREYLVASERPHPTFAIG